MLTGTPGCTFEALNVSYFCFACVMPFFVNDTKDLVFVFHQHCSLMPIFWVLRDPPFILSPSHSPINWLPENRFSRCQESLIRERETRLYHLVAAARGRAAATPSAVTHNASQQDPQCITSLASGLRGWRPCIEAGRR